MRIPLAHLRSNDRGRRILADLSVLTDTTGDCAEIDVNDQRVKSLQVKHFWSPTERAIRAGLPPAMPVPEGYDPARDFHGEGCNC